jgi:ankyrin repeat protein
MAARSSLLVHTDMILAPEERVIPEILLSGLNAISKGRVDLLLQLLDTGLTTTLRDAKHRTLLHHAAKSGNSALVLLLLNRSAQVNSVDEQHWAALHVAGWCTRGFFLSAVLALCRVYVCVCVSWWER